MNEQQHAEEVGATVAGLAMDSAVTPVSDEWFRGNIPPRWSMRLPNGGFLAVVAMRAVAEIVESGTPRAVSAVFLRRARTGPVAIRVERLVSSSNGLHITRATVFQRERSIMEAIVWVGDDRGGVRHRMVEPPHVPKPAELVSFDEIWPRGPGAMPIRENFDGAAVPGFHANARETPDFICWTRYRPVPTFSDPFVDVGRGLILADIYTGVSCSGPYQYMNIGFPATIQFQATFWQTTASEWLLVDSRSPIASRGYLDASATVWDECRNPFVTMSSQLVWLGNGMT